MSRGLFVVLPALAVLSWGHSLPAQPPPPETPPTCAAPEAGPWCFGESVPCFATVSARANVCAWICRDQPVDAEGDRPRSLPVPCERGFRTCESGETCGCARQTPAQGWEQLPACLAPLVPEPEDAAGVSWKQTEVGPDVCVLATPHHLEAVRAAQARVPLVPGEGEAGYHPRICAALRADGLDCAWYGEELAVARDSSHSENYDLVLASGHSRLAFYASTCTPATRSTTIDPLAPAPLPAIGRVPVFPQRVDAIRAKVHVPADRRPDGQAVIDSVGLWSCRGLPECQCGGAPRDAIPACGCESDDAARKAEIVACSMQLAEDVGLRWEAGTDHPSNPWLHLAAPGVRVRVCTAAGVCSAFVEGR
jgi:hypothetical protein